MDIGNEMRHDGAGRDIVRRAREYLAENAAESGADVLLDELATEVEELRRELYRAWDEADAVRPERKPTHAPLGPDETAF